MQISLSHPPAKGPADRLRQGCGGPPKLEAKAEAGHNVRVRGARWRIVDVRAYEDCSSVTLSGVGPENVGVERRVLAPFDTIEPVGRMARPRTVRRTEWRRACRALLASDTPPGSLRSARVAQIDLMPHQLEPALAVVRGLGSRLLLADEVGLGKTIQAGLVVSELRVRGEVDRVLILTPAGLREQWVRELSERFAFDTTSVDAALLRRLATSLPIGVNPWSTVEAAIASVDYVKRPEVLPAVAACRWDVVVVDEAHGVAGDSGRHDAIQALTSRAAYVLLLTATPHSGDRRSFLSLCNLGSADGDSLLVFRRTRIDVRIGTLRRVHTLHVRPTADEQRMHTLLAQYSDAVQAERRSLRHDACLALSVLHKRAFSSAWSLAQSVERRLAALALAPGVAGPAQLGLPLGDGHGEFASADEPPSWPADVGLSDSARETRLLTTLAASAYTAAARETKLSALRRLLRRAGESAVVFTEYRDTLLHLRHKLGSPLVCLHGGLTRDERAAALAHFARTPRCVLLATDAAGEGLNLHHACRLVINLELPWNPMRLEQRIGRVDRIGQGRTVHAFHLVAGGTGEARILSRLEARVAAAQTDIGAPNPMGADGERAVARLVITGAENDGDDDGGPADGSRC
jgi:superfamily II DNA or RNA helicase